MPDITVAVPTDVNGRRYGGTQRKLMAGKVIGATDFAAPYAYLVAADGQTPLFKAEDAAHANGDYGVMALGVRKDVPTALAGTDGDYAPHEVDALGSSWVRQQTVSVSSDVSLNSSASSAQLLAANTSRRGLLLTNTDANDVYLYYGTTATLTKFTVKIPPGAYWEMPNPVYTGRIDCLWSSDGSGALIGSEL